MNIKNMIDCNENKDPRTKNQRSIQDGATCPKGQTLRPFIPLHITGHEDWDTTGKMWWHKYENKKPIDVSKWWIKVKLEDKEYWVKWDFFLELTLKEENEKLKTEIKKLHNRNEEFKNLNNKFYELVDLTKHDDMLIEQLKEENEQLKEENEELKKSLWCTAKEGIILEAENRKLEDEEDEENGIEPLC